MWCRNGCEGDLSTLIYGQSFLHYLICLFQLLWQESILNNLGKGKVTEWPKVRMLMEIEYQTDPALHIVTYLIHYDESLSLHHHMLDR